MRKLRWGDVDGTGGHGDHFGFVEHFAEADRDGTRQHGAISFVGMRVWGNPSSGGKSHAQNVRFSLLLAPDYPRGLQGRIVRRNLPTEIRRVLGPQDLRSVPPPGSPRRKRRGWREKGKSFAKDASSRTASRDRVDAERFLEAQRLGIFCLDFGSGKDEQAHYANNRAEREAKA